MRLASKTAILSTLILAAGGAVAQSTMPAEGQPVTIGGVETPDEPPAERGGVLVRGFDGA